MGPPKGGRGRWGTGRAMGGLTSSVTPVFVHITEMRISKIYVHQRYTYINDIRISMIYVYQSASLPDPKKRQTACLCTCLNFGQCGISVPAWPAYMACKPVFPAVLGVPDKCPGAAAVTARRETQRSGCGFGRCEAVRR